MQVACSWESGHKLLTRLMQRTAHLSSHACKTMAALHIIPALAGAASSMLSSGEAHPHLRRH